jgi:hypothetical protein
VLVAWAAAIGIVTNASAREVTFRVDGATGSDTHSCGTEAAPCATIQHAVELATAGDVVVVAQGIYTGATACSMGGPAPEAVVCIQKDIAILGGYATGDWSVPDPMSFPTVIDGQGARRGIIINGPSAGLRLEGFTIRNCLAHGTGNQFGGGLWSALAGQGTTLRDLLFQSNVAQAGDGGQAGGGGAAIQGNSSTQVTATLERLTFVGNQAKGGSGTSANAGLGGGLELDRATVRATHLSFENNLATGGEVSGNPIPRAIADGLGGAFAISFGGAVEIEALTMIGNTARGGSAPDGRGGFGFGGGLYIEGSASAPAITSVNIMNAEIRDNTAEGGAGGEALGGGSGGGILSFGGQLLLDRAVLIRNRAIGASNGGGPAGGGGAFLWLPEATSTIRNSIFAENEANGDGGGGGAGLRLLGTDATVTHTTFVDNNLTGTVNCCLGSAILAGPQFATGDDSSLELAFSLVANHTSAEAQRAAVFIQKSGDLGASGDFTRNHFVGNSFDTCEGGALCGTLLNWPGDNIRDPSQATFFVDPPASDYHITSTSPPVDEATGSTEGFDVDGAARSGSRDIGADEFGAAASRLSVFKNGGGTGLVISSPLGIDCGTDCSEHFPVGTEVTLAATPDAGSAFGDYGGDADCEDGVVFMDSDHECIAPFIISGPGVIVVEKQTVPNGRTETFVFVGDLSGKLSDGMQFSSSGLGTGTYTVTELDHPLFDLTGIVCDDLNSTGDPASGTATLKVDGGETVTCTFTNTLTNCTAPDDLVLSDETVNNSITVEGCSSITAGPYTIGPSGDVVFETLRVVLRSGFVAQGNFTVLLNVP